MHIRALLVIVVLFLVSGCRAELIGYWDFDGDISNSAKNSELKAEQYGKINFTEGLGGKALLTDGGGALIVKNSDIFNNIKAFSISFWAKLNPENDNTLDVFVSKGGEKNEGWQVRTYRDYGFASFTVRGSKGKKADCFAGERVDDGRWHHIAAVYDGRFAELYIDGRFADIKDVPRGGIGKTESPLVIAAKIVKNKKAPYAFLKGAIDELKIFNAAISSEQVKALAKRDALLREKLTKMYKDFGVYPIPIHRGGGKYQPENTIESFEYSWQRNLVPEGDIRMTRDNQIVFLHDNDVKRTAPSAPDEFKDKLIGELTLSQLKTLDVGEFWDKPGQKIPTIEEVFEVMSKDPAKFIYLDYKTIDMDRLAALVKKYGIEKQVIFTTKNYDLIRYWRKLLPESQTMIWMGDSQQAIERKLNYLGQYDFEGIYIVHLHYKPVGNSFQLSDEFMLSVRERLGKKGIIVQIMPWNIKDSDVYERLFKLGIDAVGTDYPDVLLPVYEKYFKK